MNEVYTDLEHKENPYDAARKEKQKQIELEDKRYFGPDPEDVHIGYECELRIFYLDIPPKWIPHKLQSTIFNPDNIRVPYLTKEQIEAEGWEDVTNISDFAVWGNYSYIKGDFKLEWYYLKNQIVLKPIRGITLPPLCYGGDCKDINTFRYICKLLHI